MNPLSCRARRMLRKGMCLCVCVCVFLFPACRCYAHTRFTLLHGLPIRSISFSRVPCATSGYATSPFFDYLCVQICGLCSDVSLVESDECRPRGWQCLRILEASSDGLPERVGASFGAQIDVFMVFLIRSLDGCVMPSYHHRWLITSSPWDPSPRLVRDIWPY